MDSKIKNKLPARLACLFLVVLSVVGLMTACDGSGKGSSVEIEITNKTENNVMKDVVIKNNGDCDAYVRISVIANWRDSDENVVAAYDASSIVASDFGDDWVKHENYFYYKKPIAAGTVVPNDFTFDANDLEMPEGADHLEITLSAQSVKADEVDSSSGQKAVVVAWGIDPESLS